MLPIFINHNYYPITQLDNNVSTFKTKTIFIVYYIVFKYIWMFVWAFLNACFLKAKSL